MTADRELYELLGLESPDALTRVAHAEPPAAARAEGASARPLLALLAGLAWRPAFAEELPGFAVYRADDEPAFLSLPADAVRDVIRGQAVEHDGMVGFDTRGERVVVRVAGEGRAFLLDAEDGRVTLYAAADRAPPEAAIPAPDVAAWAAAAGAEPWLADTAARLAAAPSALERAAGAGVLARLWTRPEGARIRPDDHPRERVRAWVRGLPDGAMPALEASAVARAQALAGRIEAFDALPDAQRAGALAALVRERDDLQSVRRVLRLAGAGEALAEALARLDRAAAEHMSALADHLPALADDPDADRWHAVAWQEPDAWWTGL